MHLNQSHNTTTLNNALNFNNTSTQNPLQLASTLLPLNQMPPTRSPQHSLYIRGHAISVSRNNQPSFLQRIKEAIPGTTSRLIKKTLQNTFHTYHHDDQAQQIDLNFGHGTADSIHIIDQLVSALASKKSFKFNELTDPFIANKNIKQELIAVINGYSSFETFKGSLASISISSQQSNIFNHPELQQRLSSLLNEIDHKYESMDQNIESIQHRANAQVERLRANMLDHVPEKMTLLDDLFPIKGQVEQLCYTSSLLKQAGLPFQDNYFNMACLDALKAPQPASLINQVRDYTLSSIHYSNLNYIEKRHISTQVNMSLDSLLREANKHRRTQLPLMELTNAVKWLPDAQRGQEFLNAFTQRATRQYLGKSSEPNMMMKINSLSSALFTGQNAQVSSSLKNEIMDTMQNTDFAITTYGSKSRARVTSTRSFASDNSIQFEPINQEEMRLSSLHQTLSQQADVETANLLNEIINHAHELNVIDDKADVLSKFTEATQKKNGLDIFKLRLSRIEKGIRNLRLSGPHNQGETCIAAIHKLEIHLAIKEPERQSESIEGHTDKMLNDMYAKLATFTQNQKPELLDRAEDYIHLMKSYRNFIANTDKFELGNARFKTEVQQLPVSQLQKEVLAKQNENITQAITQLRPIRSGNEMLETLKGMKNTLESLYLDSMESNTMGFQADSMANQKVNEAHRLVLDYMFGNINYNKFNQKTQKIYSEFAQMYGAIENKIALNIFFRGLIDTATETRPEIEKQYKTVVGPVQDRSNPNPLSEGQKPFFDEFKKVIEQRTGLKPGLHQKLTPDQKEKIYKVWLDELVKTIEHKPQNGEAYGAPRNREFQKNNKYIGLTTVLKTKIAVCRELSIVGATLLNDYGIKAQVGYGKVGTNNGPGGSHAWIELLDDNNQIQGVLDSNYTISYHPSYADYEAKSKGIIRNSQFNSQIEDFSRVVDIYSHHPLNGVTQIQ
ncbi:MAG: hypothetical protein VX185_02015 [Pseudomonadota bacterium]|nr:hypothetical protein [Pseudomonadota bacterium]